jgi:uncharacterized membrane protein YbhN (UPF0104 family)
MEFKPSSTTSFRQWGKHSLKVVLTGAALYFVVQKISFEAIWEEIRQVSALALAAGVLLFTLSKIISTYRLHVFYKAIGLQLPWLYQLQLYWVGMFYNLFLPGSIGGDGYKVYLLQQMGGAKTKALVTATLLDRISGMVLLVWFAAMFTAFSAFQYSIPFGRELAFAVFLLAPLGYGLCIYWFMPSFKQTTLPALHGSFWVQLSQIFCAVCILNGLGLELNYWEYLTLFMVSSAVSVIPISIGGAGAREMVFYYGLALISLDQKTAIAFSLIFFGITVIVSLVGLVFVVRIDHQKFLKTT